MLENTCKIVFYCIWWLKCCNLRYEISSFPEVLYKRGVLKSFSKFTDKHKKQSSGGVLSKDVFKTFAKFTEKHLFRSLFFNKAAGWKPETVRSTHWRCSLKQGVLQNSANLTEKIYAEILRDCNFIKAASNTGAFL